jgi:hypothetical protein
MRIEVLSPETDEVAFDKFVEDDSPLGFATLKHLNDHLYIETILKMAPPSSDEKFIGNEYFVG